MFPIKTRQLKNKHVPKTTRQLWDKRVLDNTAITKNKHVPNATKSLKTSMFPIRAATKDYLIIN